ncbi:hypothetical protein KXV65_005592 [Aspergillus fumigatus]|nr:hypothetical protein KXX19_004524 [Aspergillus fumigatus]KAH2033887.1 hypothetical protein KXV65_005592 [Aspergillus fumigatus]KAH2084452.1 hypothetical protein KXX03_002353 [Aspergillus fumigatus]KAH2263693.1 hypothetical protein KXW26_005384 [Aspergillus fumigatus]KAH2453110.1 hypothetical protein KXV83_005303 [Aspergillus fumigatus]
MATEDIEGWILEATECSPMMMQRVSETNVSESLSGQLSLSSLGLSVKHPANYMLMDHSTCLIDKSLENDKETNSPTSPVKMSQSHSPTEGSDVEVEEKQNISPEQLITRLSAINLIRARTITRLSPTESLSSGDTFSPFSDRFHSSSGHSAESNPSPVVVMQPVPTLRKRKKKKKKKKKKTRNRNRGVNSQDSMAEGPSGSRNETHICRTPHVRPSVDSYIQAQGEKDNQQMRSPEPPEPAMFQSNWTSADCAPSHNELQQGDADLQPGPGTVGKPSSAMLNLGENPGSSVTSLHDKVISAGEASPVPSSSQHPGANKDSRRPANSAKKMLPSIEEAASEATQDSLSNDASTFMMRSKSLSARTQIRDTSPYKAASTILTADEHAPSKPESEKDSSSVTNLDIEQSSQQTPYSKDHESPHFSNSHSHPSPPAESDISTLSTPKAHRNVSSQRPDAFFWQLDSHGFPCAKQSCDKRCNLWDGRTVICPKCGPFSEVRYCCKEHLLQDIKWHWVYCGQMTFTEPCRENSVPRDVRDGPPLLPCLHPYDTPERHRQAVYFNVNIREGDYFVFSDYADWAQAGVPEINLEMRCSHRVLYTIKFEDREKKDRFRRILAACLFMTIEVHGLVDYMYRLIRDDLRSQEIWSPEVENMLKYQIHSEFAINILPDITGERHACETDWTGRNRRHCPDAVCRGEYRRLLGSVGGHGHRQTVDHLEESFWILRAARTTHPDVTDVHARMRGDGFEGVAEEDRRVFQRGEGWDGAGTGPMEIESINA